MNTPSSIRGELTPDPNVCNFILDRPLIEEGWSVVFDSDMEAMESPLIERLFEIDGLMRVRVTGAEISMTKEPSFSWQELAGQIVPVLREVLAGEHPPISAAALDAVKNLPPEEIAPCVEDLLNTHINPALASHGGYARLVKVEDRDVFVEMGGGCQGCAASKATLRFGIEAAIRQVAPQVREVVDVTDHASGTNPYFS